MAITAVDFAVWTALREQNLLPERPDVLEIGEANWHGDVSDEELAKVLGRTPDAEESTFDKARDFYTEILNPSSLDAIDLHGPAAWKYDLNEPVPVSERYGVVINNGTAEHIWNQYQLFKTIHDLTLPGGIMYHFLPMTGWLDHGFFTYSPTFVADLCMANRYSIIAWVVASVSPLSMRQVKNLDEVHAGQIPANAVMVAVLQKPQFLFGFLTPQQGYYAGGLSKEGHERWHQR